MSDYANVSTIVGTIEGDADEGGYMVSLSVRPGYLATSYDVCLPVGPGWTRGEVEAAIAADLYGAEEDTAPEEVVAWADDFVTFEWNEETE